MGAMAVRGRHNATPSSGVIHAANQTWFKMVAASAALS